MGYKHTFSHTHTSTQTQMWMDETNGAWTTSKTTREGGIYRDAVYPAERATMTNIVPHAHFTVQHHHKLQCHRAAFLGAIRTLYFNNLVICTKKQI